MHDAPRSRCRRFAPAARMASTRRPCARWRRRRFPAAWSAAPGWLNDIWGRIRAWAVPRSFRKRWVVAFRPPATRMRPCAACTGWVRTGAPAAPGRCRSAGQRWFCRGAMPPPRSPRLPTSPRDSTLAPDLGSTRQSRTSGQAPVRNTAMAAAHTSAHAPVLGGCSTAQTFDPVQKCFGHWGLLKRQLAG